MAWWKKLFSGDTDSGDVDYYREGLELLKVGKYHEALTSFRLAQRESPDDRAIVEQIAITYTQIGMTEEAARTYRTVLAREPDEPGAHYGLAFLLLKDGRRDEAIEHLRAFLARPPAGAEAEPHRRHARKTLGELTGEIAAEENDGTGGLFPDADTGSPLNG